MTFRLNFDQFDSVSESKGNDYESQSITQGTECQQERIGEPAGTPNVRMAPYAGCGSEPA